MGTLSANSREENSLQKQQQRSNTNHTHRPNLNMLFPQPRLPINRPNEIILVPNDFQDPYLSRSFNLKSLKLDKRSKTYREEWVKPLINNNLQSMMGYLEDDLKEHIDVLLY
ncbi:Cytochrome P450 protein [Gossypium arboreum]|uniref:Cytochrome P450 protein n=1 Tax=Gossypium arboreum TaxID=29729 RepID=A0A0B0PAF5_GOSAR|nr:Cytochrome P450 protein [Gossypium arboreum]